LFMLISENNMNTSTYIVHTLSLIYIMKLILIFRIKIYRKLPSYLTKLTKSLVGSSKALFGKEEKHRKMGAFRSGGKESYGSVWNGGNGEKLSIGKAATHALLEEGKKMRSEPREIFPVRRARVLTH
jgi:hypothetical protein